MYAPHALLSGKAVKLIENSAVEELLITNTIPLPNKKQSTKINTISIGKLLAEAIANVHMRSLHNKDTKNNRL